MSVIATANRAVTIDEPITMVNVAPGSVKVLDCESGDANGDASIIIDAILRAGPNAKRRVGRE